MVRVSVHVVIVVVVVIIVVVVIVVVVVDRAYQVDHSVEDCHHEREESQLRVGVAADQGMDYNLIYWVLIPAN